MGNALAQTDPRAYKKYKETKLPAVTFAGTFPPEKRKALHLDAHSGLVVLKFCGVTTEQIPDLLAALAQDPQVVLAFISPSEQGIKVVVRVNPVFHANSKARIEAFAIRRCPALLGFLTTEGSRYLSVMHF